jgi:hypothetical protein
MPSNIRSKPIEGSVSDSAGNVLRNSTIVIKEVTPFGSNVIDTIPSNDDGYFKSRPIPPGSYDIYESGVRISRHIHQPGSEHIQVFKSSESAVTIYPFQDLIDNDDINLFRHFIQIESDDVDVEVYGNTFQLYKPKFVDTYTLPIDNNYKNLYDFFKMASGSCITTTRFDIELYYPLTSAASTYKRIRWAGVPALKMSGNSKLILPLDYYSIVANLPKLYANESGAPLGTSEAEISNVTDGRVTIDGDGDFISKFMNRITVGDIVRFFFTDGTEVVEWYGIYISKNAGNDVFTFDKWKSSRFVSGTPANSMYAVTAQAFDGMFPGIVSINETANELFTVTENNYAQNLGGELYTYENS